LASSNKKGIIHYTGDEITDGEEMSNVSEKNLIRSVGRDMLYMMEMGRLAFDVLPHRCMTLKPSIWRKSSTRRI
jgi:hypothetical protein